MIFAASCCCLRIVRRPTGLSSEFFTAGRGAVPTYFPHFAHAPSLRFSARIDEGVSEVEMTSLVSKNYKKQVPGSSKKGFAK
jgi:hypothetical protein